MTNLSVREARILIVDDQEANVLLLEGLLAEGGYRSWRSVLDPRTAVAVCAEYGPDLILLDLVMPHLDGFGVLEQLRPWLASQSYLPILVLTVDITTESRRRALAAGAKDFLAKPLDATEVLLRVKNLLETRFLYRRLEQRADQRIREQAALIDEANDAILVCDLGDRITFWNRGAEKLYGWTAAEVAGKTFARLLCASSSEELEQATRVMAVTGRWEGELPQRHRDGREILVASRWTLLADAAGRPRSRLIINTDITEKKKVEEKVLRAQRLENVDRLASGIAHDLNNIFTPLTMGLDLLGMTYPPVSDDPLLATLRASVRRGANLVRQILTFARGVEGPHRPVALQPLIDELVLFFGETFPKSITITSDVPESLWPVSADPTQLYQLITNLCINARDAMPQGGTLRITARNQSLEEPGPADPSKSSSGRSVVLTVEDTGTGIPAELLDKIFEPFFTTKEVGKGTGLGLATAQSIVRNHGGRIEVQSARSEGSRFTVVLPALDAPAPPEPVARTPPAGKGELVMVVDDEALILNVARIVLTQAGYRVVTAANGAEAVALFSENSQAIQAVLIDLMMPVMSGVETIRALRRLNPGVKVIALSGLYTSSALDAAVVPPIHDILPKPYTIDALLEAVRSVLDASHPLRAAPNHCEA